MDLREFEGEPSKSVSVRFWRRHTQELMKRSHIKIVKLSPKWLACGHGLPVRFDKALPVIEEYLGG